MLVRLGGILYSSRYTCIQYFKKFFYDLSGCIGRQLIVLLELVGNLLQVHRLAFGLKCCKSCIYEYFEFHRVKGTVLHFAFILK